MIQKKIIIYQKHAAKPIVLTETTDQSEADIIASLSPIFKEKNIFTIKTNKDILLVRPSDVQAILITDCDYEKSKIESTLQKKLEIPE